MELTHLVAGGVVDLDGPGRSDSEAFSVGRVCHCRYLIRNPKGVLLRQLVPSKRVDVDFIVLNTTYKCTQSRSQITVDRTDSPKCKHTPVRNYAVEPATLGLEGTEVILLWACVPS